ncbi:MAG TPA: rhodanese-like domain-containing protein [Bacteroidales bacterium]|nr:rhodanese-like domain-containing protein [Bacteroidales bacterium]
MTTVFFDKAFISHGVINVTPADAFNLCISGAILVDVREEYMSNFKLFRVNKTLYLPLSTLASSYTSLPNDIPLVVADSVGLRSLEAVEFLMSHGFENAANLSGGIIDWEHDGFPVITDKSLRLSGSCVCQLKLRESK